MWPPIRELSNSDFFVTPCTKLVTDATLSLVFWVIWSEPDQYIISFQVSSLNWIVTHLVDKQCTPGFIWKCTDTDLSSTLSPDVSSKPDFTDTFTPKISQTKMENTAVLLICAIPNRVSQVILEVHIGCLCPSWFTSSASWGHMSSI